MTLSGLVRSIKANAPQFNFYYDELGMTWQVSYVRLVEADKTRFDSMEHFYFSIICSEKNQSSHYLGQLNWKSKTDLTQWAENLVIIKIGEDEFGKDLQEAIVETAENEMEWEQCETIDRTKINIPKDILSIWSIEESNYRRHPVGATWAKIVDTKDSFFYLERHWES